MAFAERRGKWWRGRYRRPDGTYGSTAGHRTKTRALAAAEDEESRIRHHTWIDRRSGEISFGEFAEQWYAAVTPRLGPRTVEKYRGYLDNQLLPKWDPWPMLGIFNSHLEIEKWVTSLHEDYEESSVASYFGLFSTIMNAAVRARVIPASPCPGIRVTDGAWESDKLVATPVQGLRAALRLYESGLGLGGLVLCLMNLYTGARWGELTGQLRHEYDELNCAIGIFEPLKEVNGKLVKAGTLVEGGRLSLPPGQPGRRSRRAKRGARTKTAAGTRWVRLSPSIAVVYEALLELRPEPDSFVFVSTTGRPWFRSNFRQRYWRPAWDGVKPEDPDGPDHVPALLPGFRFHEGRHTHTTWLAEDAVPEIARRARVGHRMPGIARVYEHVTPEMHEQISEALEARWLAATLSLSEEELAKLLGWVPQLRIAVEAARRNQRKASVAR